jgi:alpha-ketoglutaric semialdehyde dehydrogenase
VGELIVKHKESLAKDMTREMGKACSRVVVHKSFEKITSRLLKRAKNLRLGDGLKNTTDVGPLINKAQRQKVLSYCKLGVEEGAKLLLGGNVYKKGYCRGGFFFEPTLFAGVSPKMRIAQEEIFGSVLSMLEY